MKHVLISGGSGLTGSALTRLLISSGYRVSHLSTTGQESAKDVKVFRWDPAKKEIDTAAFEGVDTVVHLAGAGVAEKRWSEERKRILFESRVGGAELIYNSLQKNRGNVTAVLSASGTGYYGNTGDELINEEHVPGNDFLARLCIEWEERINKIHGLGIRTAAIRTGVVISEKGGALPILARSVKWFAGAPFGDGKQYFPWVHLEDLCGIYFKIIEDDKMSGPYNASAPQIVTNKEFTETVGRVLHRPILLPRIPAFALKIIFGELSEPLLFSNKISADKIKKAGYVFRYPALLDAINSCFTSD